MKPVEHGTSRGYRAELRRRLIPCKACLKAACEETKTGLRKNRCAPGLGWPLGPGDIAPRKYREKWMPANAVSIDTSG